MLSREATLPLSALLPILMWSQLLKELLLSDYLCGSKQEVTNLFLFVPGSSVCSASDLRATGLWFNTPSGHILSLLLLLIQEVQLSVTGESVYTNYWLTSSEV